MYLLPAVAKRQKNSHFKGLRIPWNLYTNDLARTNMHDGEYMACTNGCYFADDNFMCILFREMCCFSIPFYCSLFLMVQRVNKPLSQPLNDCLAHVCIYDYLVPSHYMDTLVKWTLRNTFRITKVFFLLKWHLKIDCWCALCNIVLDNTVL